MKDRTWPIGGERPESGGASKRGKVCIGRERPLTKKFYSNRGHSDTANDTPSLSVRKKSMEFKGKFTGLPDWGEKNLNKLAQVKSLGHKRKPEKIQDEGESWYGRKIIKVNS